MTGEAFRRDRLLRASGYEIGTWGVVNLALAIPAWSASSGRPWPPVAIGVATIALAAAAVLAGLLHRNRAAKLCGETSPRVIADPARIWLPLVAAGLVISAVLIADGAVGRLVPVWLALAGAGHVVWGSFTIGEIGRLGRGLLAAAAVTAAIGERGSIGVATLGLWGFAMGAAWIATGVAIHRRYLRPRPRPARDQPQSTP